VKNCIEFDNDEKPLFAYRQTPCNTWMDGWVIVLGGHCTAPNFKGL